MIPHGIDVHRFEFLLREGISRDELEDFFTSQKTGLIIAGERVQNLPADLRAAVKRFSPAAHGLLRNWLSSRPLDNPIDPDQIVPTYRATEELGLRLSEDEQSVLAASTLHLLYGERPPESLLAFLRTPIKEVGSVAPELIPQVTTADWREFIGSVDTRKLAPGLKHPVLRPAARLLSALALGERSLIAEETDVAVTQAFEDETARRASIRATETPPAARRGLQRTALEVRPFDPATDYTALQVIATRYSHRSDDRVPWFATVEGFVKGTDVFLLDRKDLVKAIPTEGEIVIHKDRGFPAPIVGEARLYEVEQIHNDYRAKVRATSALDRLIPVVSLPYPSSDAQSIRQFITEVASKSELADALFVTTDDVCLHTREGSLASVNRADYEWQLEGWSRLDAYELPSGSYVLKPLPPATTAIDCAPLPRVARRLLKAAADRSGLNLPKAQRDTLIAVLGDEKFQASSITRARLRENLSSIDHSSDDYAELIDLLMQVPRVRKDVDERTTAAVNARLAEKTSESQKVENLKQQRRALESVIEQLERDKEEKSRAVKLAIRKAFTAAPKRELDVLGEASLISALLQSRPAVAEPHAADPAVPPVSRELVGQVSPCSGKKLAAVLLGFGFSTDASESIAEAVQIASQSGIAVVLEGTGCSELGEMLAASISKGYYRSAELGVGLIDQVLPPGWLASSECDVLLLKQANLSDLSAYGPKLIASVVQRALPERSGGSQPALVLTAASGPAALPWPAEMVALALKINIDDVEQMTRTPEDPPLTTHPLQRGLLTRIEAKATREDCSRAALQLLKRMIIS